MQRYKDALIEKLRVEYGGDIKFPEGYSNTGTNKLSSPIMLPNGKEVFLAVVHGKDPVKALKRIKYFKEYGDFTGDYEIGSGEGPADFQSSPDHEAILKATNSPYPSNGVKDKLGNTVNANIYKIHNYGTVKVDGVETAYYIAENIIGHFTKLDGNDQYPPNKALQGGRNFSALNVIAEKLKREKGIDYASDDYLGEKDPYSPELQLSKLKAIAEDEDKLMNVGIGRYHRQVVEEYTREEALTLGRETIDRMMKIVSEIKEFYDDIKEKLKKGLVHGDPWFDNVIEERKKDWDPKKYKDFMYEIGKMKTIDLDDAGFGYLLMDAAMAINARNGVDHEGNLNLTGKNFLLSWNEVEPIAGIEEYLNLMMANGGSYIAVMRVEKDAAGDHSKRDFLPELERAERHLVYHKEQRGNGLAKDKKDSPDAIILHLSGLAKVEQEKGNAL